MRKADRATKTRQNRFVAVLTLIAAAVGLSVSAVQAQNIPGLGNSYAPYSNATMSGVDGYTAGYTSTVHTPLIDGATSTAPGMTAPQGMAPPVGSGSVPLPVTPGQLGGPTLLPWNINTPANLINSSGSQVSLPYTNSALTAPGVLGPALAGSVPFAPSTPGTDPGILPGPPSFKAPPAAVVNVAAQGGMPGDYAPQTRWGAQTTTDYGLVRTKGSQLTDFGQPLNQMTNLATTPQYSQDGPRTATYPGVIGQVNRAPNMSGAQVTQDLYGQQTAFKGTSNLPLQTIAPF